MTNFSSFAIGERIGTNVPVIVTQPQGQRVNLGLNATFTVTATGVGQLDYQWMHNGNLLPGATSSSLTISNVQDPDAGNYAAVVNNGGPVVTSSNALLTINHPPVLGFIPDQTLGLQTNLLLQLSANDPDGGPLTFVLIAGPTGMSLTPGGLLSWAPTQAQRPSSNPVSVQVHDDGIPPLTSTTNFTVIALDTNHPPVLMPVPPQTNFVGVTLMITNSATDPDFPANHLTFSLGSNAPAGASIDPNTGLFTWTLPGPNGSFNSFTITVTDDGSPPLSDSQRVTVAIEPAFAPRIVSIQFLPSNYSLLSVTGTPNQIYWIQSSAVLSTPSPWANIGTNTTGLNGLSQFLDAQATNAVDRFYRLAVP
jgi:hypothetical protein